MAANEDIWQTLQKISDGFPDNGEQVITALLAYYESIKRNSVEMEKTAQDFFKINSEKRIKLLAMVVYGDIHDYVPGTSAIYRGPTVSKKVLLSDNRISEEDDREGKIQIFTLALSGSNNSALKEMKKSFEAGSDTTPCGKYNNFYAAIMGLFKSMFFFEDEDAITIVNGLLPLFYPDGKPESDNAEMGLSQPQRIKEGFWISQLNISEAVIEIMKRIQEKIDSCTHEDGELRDDLVSFKNDVARMDHKAKGQPGLYRLFQVYSKSFAEDSSFSEDLRALCARYDRCANDAGKPAFSFKGFDFTLFSVKTKKVMEIFNKDTIIEELNEINACISNNSKILENSAADETKELILAIQESGSALDSVKATSTIENVEQNLSVFIGNLSKIVAIASWGINQSLNKEIYETIQAKTKALLTIVKEIYLPILEEAEKQRETNKRMAPLCGGR